MERLLIIFECFFCIQRNLPDRVLLDVPHPNLYLLLVVGASAGPDTQINKVTL